MRIVVVGNCQIGVILTVLKSIHKDITGTYLPSVQDLNSSYKEQFEDEYRKADLIIAQPVKIDYPVDFVRTYSIANSYRNKLVTFPNSFFTGYSPDWSVIHDNERANYYGPLRSYHSAKLLYAYFTAMTVDQAVQFMSSPSEFDAHLYSDEIRNSLGNLHRRELSTDLKISDFIEENYRRRRLFHIMNHPNLETLVTVSKRILTFVGEKYNDCSPDLFTDLDLIESWHPENAYIRYRENFKFAPQNYFRGCEMIQDSNNPNGFSPGGVKIYSLHEMVETFFAFYEFNKDRLRQHPSVSALLDFGLDLGTYKGMSGSRKFVHKVSQTLRRFPRKLVEKTFEPVNNRVFISPGKSQ